MSDLTKLPKDLKECLEKAGHPLSEEQFMLVAGYLASYQSMNLVPQLGKKPEGNVDFAVTTVGIMLSMLNDKYTDDEILWILHPERLKKYFTVTKSLGGKK